MMALIIAIAGMCAASVAVGVIAHGKLARQPVTEPGIPAVSAGNPEEWRAFARNALAPDRSLAALVVWLMIVDTALALAAPWPLQLVVDYGLGGYPFPAWSHAGGNTSACSRRRRVGGRACPARSRGHDRLPGDVPRRRERNGWRSYCASAS